MLLLIKDYFIFLNGIIYDYHEQSDAEYIQTSQRLHTDDVPETPSSPVDDVTYQGQVKEYSDTFRDFKAVPQRAQKTDVTGKRHIVEHSYKKKANYIENCANDTAISNGNVAMGESVVLQCGAELKDKGVKPPRNFTLTPGPGWVDVSTKSVGKKAGYIRQFGETTEIDLPPVICDEPAFSLEADVRVDDLKRFTIYGFREATIIPPRRSSKTSSSTNIVEKAATPTITTRTNKVVFHACGNNYKWGHWKYTCTT